MARLVFTIRVYRYEMPWTPHYMQQPHSKNLSIYFIFNYRLINIVYLYVGHCSGAVVFY